MQLDQRVQLFSSLGQKISQLSPDNIEALYEAAASKNNWFTLNNVEKSFASLAKMLDHNKLEQWSGLYTFSNKPPKVVGLVMAGNIPMVGFHDLLCTIISGNKVKAKLSSQDDVLMRYLIDELIAIEPEVQHLIEIVDQLKDIDAVIATGSDNSARYFKHYFGKHPHIIRQNRTSVGVLGKKETAETVKSLGNDIFQYYGLGCRNVSKLYIPTGYNLVELIDGLMPFEPIINHHKYHNNYDYNKSIYLVNKAIHLDSGFFLLRESEALVSPISVIYYEYYANEAELDLKLSTNWDKIQVIVSSDAWYEGSIPIGEAQCPEVTDYADGIDTLEFLLNL